MDENWLVFMSSLYCIYCCPELEEEIDDDDDDDEVGSGSISKTPFILPNKSKNKALLHCLAYKSDTIFPTDIGFM